MDVGQDAGGDASREGGRGENKDGEGHRGAMARLADTRYTFCEYMAEEILLATDNFFERLRLKKGKIWKKNVGSVKETRLIVQRRGGSVMEVGDEEMRSLERNWHARVRRDAANRRHPAASSPFHEKRVSAITQ
ncbi:hypothetical protein LR48_Vigan10g201100 [Vigna angularis]|uniref:Uncharacterized protein n=1 Tax=Phaseolus angularis TaxID=3914 RepID=A0A0L9VN07_PHAAN|nr:hypothetical protein LR48_Vigan10g201100 [Vigna angularis]